MPVPILSVAQMRQWEQATWATGRTEAEVIRQVGWRIAERVLRLTRPGDSVLILAGKGHNGDDARLAQPHLSERQVELLDISDPQAALSPLKSLLEKRPSLIIDGLFGIGLNRPLNEDWRQLIETINAAALPVLAVDGPSGLNAQSGEPEGAAIRASLTLTLAAPKEGLLRPEAAPYVGRLEVVPEIGLVSCPLTGEQNWTLPEDFLGYPPERSADTHKGSFGHVVIFAGSLGYHGAAVLAARGALRARPGLVTLITQENVYVPAASQLQAAMVHPWRAGMSLPPTCRAILFGPGLAASDLPAAFKAELCQLWQDSSVPVIADASGLDWLPDGPIRPDAIRIITPHPGEAARMLDTTSAKIQSNRLAAVRELSSRWGRCWVVLKGHQTMIGRHSGEAYVNCSGNAGLAQGGSGDLLSGYLAGLLAQPDLQSDVLKLARFATWQHGACADQLSARRCNWTLEELAGELGTVTATGCPS